MGSKIDHKIQKTASFQEDNFKRYIVLTLFSLSLFNRKEKGVEKRCILGVSKDTQTQITKTSRLTAVRKAISKNAASNKCWRDRGAMRTLRSKGDVVRATNENTLEVLWEGKHWASSQSITPTAGPIPWENENQRVTGWHSSNTYRSQHLEAMKMSINRGMHQEEVVHVRNGIWPH